MKRKQLHRLDKILSHAGYGTRSQIKRILRNGVVTVNGKLIKDGGIQVDPFADLLCVNDESVKYREHVYIMLNKPQGVVSATQDLRDSTVVDLLDEEYRSFPVFPVGRLDKDTEGLLLLTNDGKLAHELLSPKKQIPKTYAALVDGEVTEEDRVIFEKGVELDDGYVTMPAWLNMINPGDELQGQPSEVELTIVEGKFHQVKRMFQAVGKRVVFLKRLSMGPLQLDESLSPGKYRELSDDELSQLMKVTDRSGKLKYKLIALDVDGTLLNDDHELTEATKESIRRVRELGVQIVLCTGRGPFNTIPVMNQLGLEGLMITHNGGATVNSADNRVVNQYPFHINEVIPILDQCREEGVHYDVCTATELYVDQLGVEAAAMYENFKTIPVEIARLEKIAHPIVKFTVFGDREKLDRLEEKFEPFHLPLRRIRSGENFIDFMRPEACKGDALRWLASQLSLMKSEIIAIGNYYNDVEMIEYAGLGIAMANSPDEVRHIADEVTASNNEDGVCLALRKHVLLEDQDN